jgi:hypothetical protein
MVVASLKVPLPEVTHCIDEEFGALAPDML